MFGTQDPFACYSFGNSFPGKMFGDQPPSLLPYVHTASGLRISSSLKTLRFVTFTPKPRVHVSWVEFLRFVPETVEG